MSSELNLNDVPWKNPIAETIYYYVFFDGYPVNSGHKLYVPKKNEEKYISRCLKDAWKEGSRLKRIGQLDAFNIGMNCGAEAGQTVMWPHIHMIPRIEGDMDDPRGGVRHVVPEKGNYKTGSWELNKKTNIYEYVRR